MESPILEKSLYFASRIVRLYQYLTKEKKREHNIKTDHQERNFHRGKCK